MKVLEMLAVLILWLVVADICFCKSFGHKCIACKLFARKSKDEPRPPYDGTGGWGSV